MWRTSRGAAAAGAAAAGRVRLGFRRALAIKLRPGFAVQRPAAFAAWYFSLHMWRTSWAQLSLDSRSDVGLENAPIQIGDDGYVWYEVTAVTAARDRDLTRSRTRSPPPGSATRSRRSWRQRPTRSATASPRARTSPRSPASLARSEDRRQADPRDQADRRPHRRRDAAAFAGPKGSAAVAAGSSRPVQASYCWSPTRRAALFLRRARARPEQQQLVDPVRQRPARAVHRRSCRTGSASRSTRPPCSRRSAPGRTAAADRERHADAGRARRRRFRARLRCRRGAGRLDPPRRRPRDAGFGDAEAVRRPRELFPARIGRGRRGARPLLDHRHRAGPDLPRLRRARPRSIADPKTGRDRYEPMAEPTLEALRRLIARIPHPPARRPAADVGRHLRLSRLRHGPRDGGAGPPNPDPLGFPDAILIRPTTIVVFDAVKDEITSSRRSGRQRGISPDAGACARRRPSHGGGRRARHAARQVRRTVRVDLECRWCRNTPRDALSRHGPQAKDYIAAGDIFQVVLSQRFEAPFTLPPFALYRALRRVNPSPFLYYLDFGGFAVAGSEPGDPRPRPRWSSDNPADRRHPPARRARRRRIAGSPPNCSPIRRSAPSI